VGHNAAGHACCFNLKSGSGPEADLRIAWCWKAAAPDVGRRDQLSNFPSADKRRWCAPWTAIRRAL